MAHHSHMTDLYTRLDQVGFPRAYVKELILPDWWDDNLAADPGNRRLAEMAISRTLKIPLRDLVAPTASLSLEGVREVFFKRWQQADESRLLPAVAVARRVCELVLSSAKDLPPCRLPGHKASTLRDRILGENELVTLPLLVQHAWDLGAPVVHLDSLPDGSRRVEGMALTVAGRPCIALASSKKSPAWLIWHLAHEMGHVASGHLRAGDALDESIDFGSQVEEEEEANLFALDLVYGEKHRGGFKAARHITGAKLALEAETLARKHRIAPACIVTSYGFNMGAWGTVNNALKSMGVSEGGPEAIRGLLEEHIDLDRLPETDRHFLVQVTGLTE